MVNVYVSMHIHCVYKRGVELFAIIGPFAWLSTECSW